MGTNRVGVERVDHAVGVDVPPQVPDLADVDGVGAVEVPCVAHVGVVDPQVAEAVADQCGHDAIAVALHRVSGRVGDPADAHRVSGVVGQGHVLLGRALEGDHADRVAVLQGGMDGDTGQSGRLGPAHVKADNRDGGGGEAGRVNRLAEGHEKPSDPARSRLGERPVVEDFQQPLAGRTVRGRRVPPGDCRPDRIGRPGPGVGSRRRGLDIARVVSRHCVKGVGVIGLAGEHRLSQPGVFHPRLRRITVRRHEHVPSGQARAAGVVLPRPRHKERALAALCRQGLDVAFGQAGVQRVEDGRRVDRLVDVEDDPCPGVDHIAGARRALRQHAVRQPAVALGGGDVRREEAHQHAVGHVPGGRVDGREVPERLARHDVDAGGEVDEDAERFGHVDAGLVESYAFGHVDEQVAEAEVAQAERAEVQVVVELLCYPNDLCRRGGKLGIVLEADGVAQRGRGLDPPVRAEAGGAEDVVGIV